MRKILLFLVGIAVLWAPAVSVAGDSSQGPSKMATKAETPNSDVSDAATTCQTQRSEPTFAASHNGQTFTQFYGTNAGKGHGAGANAFGKCVSTTARHKDKNDGQDSAKSDGKDSHEGSGEDNGEDSQSQDSPSKESAESNSPKSHGKDSANPALTCKAMRANDLAHFQSTYGTRPNAFGKCVSGHANSKNS